MTSMGRDFRLPDLGEGLVEAEIVKVLVHEGEDVREDAPLLEVETDKAQVEIPSPMGGRVEKIHVQPGQTVKVGEVLVTFGATGSKDRAGGPSRSSTISEPPRASVASSAHREGPVPAAPATRRLARELGVDLRTARRRRVRRAPLRTAPRPLRLSHAPLRPRSAPSRRLLPSSAAPPSRSPPSACNRHRYPASSRGARSSASRFPISGARSPSG
ncbi:MAG: hypothetical protein DMD91_00710 [Candidatus Rokuibacteriota bacterium]|nr:MAG: hypothetical protein DMD91_00710 [Candidatus Rokubacteria bacterium]